MGIRYPVGEIGNRAGFSRPFEKRARSLADALEKPLCHALTGSRGQELPSRNPQA